MKWTAVLPFMEEAGKQSMSSEIQSSRTQWNLHRFSALVKHLAFPRAAGIFSLSYSVKCIFCEAICEKNTTHWNGLSYDFSLVSKNSKNTAFLPIFIILSRKSASAVFESNNNSISFFVYSKRSEFILEIDSENYFISISSMLCSGNKIEISESQKAFCVVIIFL